MRPTLLLLLSLFTHLLHAQTAPPPTTDQFTVTGAVRQEMAVTMADLSRFPSVNIGDVAITNHAGEARSTLKNVKGVRLKTVLEKLAYDVPSPRQLSELYFVATAADNYKVVFSWNELFNNALGDSVYLLTEHDGKPLPDLDDRIALLSPSDLRTGRRYVKGLKTIVVKRVE